MSISEKDNYIEVVVKRENDDEDHGVDRILPDTEFLAAMDFKQEEPMEIEQDEAIMPEEPEAKEQDDVIVLGSDNFMVDNNDMNSDTLDNFIVYELEDDEPAEQIPSNKPQEQIPLNKPREQVQFNKPPVKIQTGKDSEKVIFLNKNITIKRTAAAAAPTPIAKPKSGIITIEHTRPPATLISKVSSYLTSKVPLVVVEKRKALTPCISSRPFRVAKRTNNDSTSEIKLKCMCRLTQESPSVESRKQLKEFFEQMFNETTRLNPHQQRLVKSGLLQSICKAEDAVEQGKCCEKCFSV